MAYLFIAIQLPPKTLSFQAWAKQLADYAQSETLAQERGYWLAVAQTAQAGENGALNLPTDLLTDANEVPFANTEESAATVTTELDTADTTALLQEASKAYNTQINDLLLTALAEAFGEWTGQSQLLVDLEGHGREEIVEGLDVSRTVGWFTAVYPVCLPLSAHPLGQRIKAVKEHLRAIPNRGIGYGLLRYLSISSTDSETALEMMPTPQVSFNYLGQFERGGDSQESSMSSTFTVSSASRGATRNPRNPRGHLLDINCVVTDGKLHMTWTYSRNLHRHAMVEKLAASFKRALQSLVEHCLSPEAGGFTPSDFPAARLSQQELDRFVASLQQFAGSASSSGRSKWCSASIRTCWKRSSSLAKMCRATSAWWPIWCLKRAPKWTAASCAVS